MKLEKDILYKINIYNAIHKTNKEYLLYFRDIFVNEKGIIILNFSESISENSKYYNFYSDVDIFIYVEKKK